MTISVQRGDIEDDRYGVYSPMMTGMGKSVAEHPDETLFALLASGFTALGYDGVAFFHAEHPAGDPAGEVDLVSNFETGSDPAWFLPDTSRAIKPLVWQERVPFTFHSLDREGDDNVFFRDAYIYGVRGRANAGFALWQLSYASKAPLTAASHEAARIAMASVRGDEGRPLGIRVDTIVVPPALEGRAMRLLNNGQRIETIDPGSGDQVVAVRNEWAGTAKVIASDWLTA